MILIPLKQLILIKKGFCVNNCYKKNHHYMFIRQSEGRFKHAQNIKTRP